MRHAIWDTKRTAVSTRAGIRQRIASTAIKIRAFPTRDFSSAMVASNTLEASITSGRNNGLAGADQAAASDPRYLLKSRDHRDHGCGSVTLPRNITPTFTLASRLIVG